MMHIFQWILDGITSIRFWLRDHLRRTSSKSFRRIDLDLDNIDSDLEIESSDDDDSEAKNIYPLW